MAGGDQRRRGAGRGRRLAARRGTSRISADDNRQTDRALGVLLDFDGFLAEVGGGLWVKIVVRCVPTSQTCPQGLSYALTLHEPNGRRILGFDNAHARDHRHDDRGVRGYAYRSAAALFEDFWTEVDRVLTERGLQG